MGASESNDPIVGIDLGTTNSLVAWADPSRGLSPRVLADGRGRNLLPSVVRYGVNGAVEAVGDEARERAAEFPGRTVSSIKRLMGRSAADAGADAPYLSYAVVEGAGRTARVRLDGSGKVVSPQEVSAVILSSLRERASAALGVAVQRAVVTVPAYFDDAQRQATRDAGRLAGLDVVRIVNEPTAAALAYGIGVMSKEAETIAVFDLGGGTFDVSILSVIPGGGGDGGLGADFFQVLATAGDTHLGGDDVDQLLIELLRKELGGGAPGPSALRSLRDAAERAKIELSERESAAVSVDAAGARVERTITIDEFEGLIGPWVDRAIASCGRALRDAKLRADEIDKVVMVGGSTRIPLVRRRVGEFFGREAYTALNPDEVVALGAAVQGSIMAGLRADALLLDVIPLSLGLETVGGAVAKIIVRNTQVPARASEMFSTSVDGQTSIKLHVLQGEREMVSDCRSLATFHLRGIPPMPAGIPQVQVEFLVDASGVLAVNAVERRSGKRAAVQIVPNHGLTREEVERIEVESFAHAREDMTRHRVVDLIANCSLDIKWITERLEKMRGVLPGEYAERLRGMVSGLARMVESARGDWKSVDPDVMHRAKEELDLASVRMHELSIVESLKGERG